MAFKFKQSFNQGVNLDLDELRLPENAVQFIKNLTANVNQNPGNSVISGANMGVGTPIEGNAALDMGVFPLGDNFCIGFYSSEQTNEGYFFIYNSSNQHSIWLISGDTELVSKVYQSDLLPFILDPAYFISEGRCTLDLKAYINPVTGEETNYKFLIFTNNSERQYLISVTDSIATGSFTTPVGYFAGAGTFYDPVTLVHLGVPTPLDCIEIAEVASEPSDLELQNQLVRTAFQFRVKFVDVFGRESEHGIISDAYISVVGGGCIALSTELPRCLTLKFDAGNPFVDYIQIEYRKWTGNDRGGALQTGWIKYDTISKWVHAAGQQWYQRAANTTYYNTSTNEITYTFCGDKNCQPIPDEETARTEPGLARWSSSVFSINKRIGVANDVRGFQPIDPAQIAKVTYEAVIPETVPCEAPPMRTIIMYANIYRPYLDGGGVAIDVSTGTIRKSNDKVVWGDGDGDCDVANASSFKFDQVFADQENPGFIFYLAGTPYACIAEYGNYNRVSKVFTPNPTFATTTIDASTTAMSQIKLVVPAGKYVLRGSSHKSTINDANYQSTSTYIAGIITLDAAYASLDRYNYAEQPVKEYLIDCTAGDVIYDDNDDPIFIILDMSSDGDSGLVDGYVFEQEGGNTPVEMTPVFFLGGDPAFSYGSFFTDHNGFFFAGGAAGVTVRIAYDTCVSGYDFIGFSNLANKVRHGWGGGTGAECEGSGSPFNRLYFSPLGYTIYPFPPESRRTINQDVLVCDSELGIANIPIVMTKGPVALTDALGHAVLIAHNRYDYASVPWTLSPLPPLYTLLPDYSTAPDSGDLLVFSRFSACALFDCSGCSYDLSTPSVDYIPCGEDRTTDMSDYFVSAAPIGISGVQSGGRYGVGFWLFDEIGRHTFFQIGAGDAAFVNIPNFNDTTSPFPAQILCSIGYAIDSTFTVPAVFKKMAFGITENTLFSDFVDWSVDYVQFIDNTGQTNTVNPTHIRIYYGSLNEYKKLYSNTVNCSWQFITNGTSTTGDVIQFLMNGITDGSGSYFLAPGISSPVAYDSSGLFFVIDFREELRGLTNGSLFRIIRPKTCQTNYLYYEQCLVIDLVDGQVPTDMLTGTLPYKDSYLLSRLIPVPILAGQPNALPPGGVSPNPIQYTSTDLNSAQIYATSNLYNNGVLVMSVNDALTAFPFYFESPSPSDFWGSHLATRGRIGTANPYEAQVRIGTEVALSAALTDRGYLNGLSYFEDQNIFTFDRNTWGNITVVLIEVGICLFICDSDNFMSNYNQTQLEVSDSGGVNAQNQYGPFTSPRRPPGTPYGCTPKNINTIRKYQGKVMWLDAEGRLIQHNFSIARDVSTTDLNAGIAGGYSGYLMSKVGAVNVANRFGVLKYFVGGIDPRTGEYNLSSFQITGAPLSYINNNSSINVSQNETIIVDLDTGLLKGFASYTPEMYGLMPSFYQGRNFFSFKNGVPYRHHNGSNFDSAPLYCNFYGTQCPVYVIPVVNPESETVKRYFWLEIYCKENVPVGSGVMPEALFYCPSIVTEKAQSSRLLVPQFNIRDGFQTAAFLCDLNTPFDPNRTLPTTTHAIIDGNFLQGRWIRLVIKTNDNWPGSYFEWSGTITGLNGIKISGDK